MALTTKDLKGEEPEPSKAELAAEASAIEIEGRSSMNKADLEEALAVEPSATLSETMNRLDEVWRSVGHGVVNEQPVKSPTAEELDIMSDLLTKASNLVKIGKGKA